MARNTTRFKRKFRDVELIRREVPKPNMMLATTMLWTAIVLSIAALFFIIYFIG